MASTIVCTHLLQEDGQTHLRVFLSNSYSPTKDRNPDGSFRADQEWQHPDPATLRYNDLGTLITAQSLDRTLQAIIGLGADRMGGHLRVIDTTDATLVDNKLQTWEERAEYDRAEQEAAYQDHLQEQLRNQPRYDYCPRCGTQTESCKNPEHRGITKCMECGGGVGNRKDRTCVDCLDLPFRQKREAALGGPIVYASESED